jgi:hypothetical protein
MIVTAKLNRRTTMVAAALLTLGNARAAETVVRAAASGVLPTSMQREMQIHRLRELGLEIWIENQPPWELERVDVNGRPQWAASSPDNYHPPSALVFASWQDVPSIETFVETTAGHAIRRASRNFGLNGQDSRAIKVTPARYGVLEGFESDFIGKVEQVVMEVRIFVGRQPGKFPVALTAYTLQGKLGLLSEVIRRSFTNVKYL